MMTIDQFFSEIEEYFSPTMDRSHPDFIAYTPKQREYISAWIKKTIPENGKALKILLAETIRGHRLKYRNLPLIADLQIAWGVIMDQRRREIFPISLPDPEEINTEWTEEELNTAVDRLRGIGLHDTAERLKSNCVTKK